MPDIIFDNCVLSNFALSDSLCIIKRLYSHSSYITDFVAAENMKGILRGYGKLAGIRTAAQEGWLQEITLDKEEMPFFESLSMSMGLGEASAVAVAKARKYIFACDDRVARREANLLGVKLTGTIGILIKAVKKKIIDHRKADRILEIMIAKGFYSPVDSIRDVIKFRAT